MFVPETTILEEAGADLRMMPMSIDEMSTVFNTFTLAERRGFFSSF